MEPITLDRSVLLTVYQESVLLLGLLAEIADSKASVKDVGDSGSIPGLGRFLGEGNGNSLQYYCLENPMDRGAWLATVPGIAKSRTQLRNFHFNFHRQA